MKEEIENLNKSGTNFGDKAAARVRKHYQPPRLLDYGTITELTLTGGNKPTSEDSSTQSLTYVAP